MPGIPHSGGDGANTKLQYSSRWDLAALLKEEQLRVYSTRSRSILTLLQRSPATAIACQTCLVNTLSAPQPNASSLLQTVQGDLR